MHDKMYLFKFSIDNNEKNNYYEPIGQNRYIAYQIQL